MKQLEKKQEKKINDNDSKDDETIPTPQDKENVWETSMGIFKAPTKVYDKPQDPKRCIMLQSRNYNDEHDENTQMKNCTVEQKDNGSKRKLNKRKMKTKLKH